MATIATESEIEEEKRIIYVALTRAQQFCAVAAPNNETALANGLRDRGFVLS